MTMIIVIIRPIPATHVQPVDALQLEHRYSKIQDDSYSFGRTNPDEE
jgi:hypothetical protein